MDAKDRLIEHLNHEFLHQFPTDAAELIESKPRSDILPVLKTLPPAVLVPVWSKLVPQLAASLLLDLPTDYQRHLLSDLAPDQAVRILTQLNESQAQEMLSLLPLAVQRELIRLMSYPENSAGRLMDPRVPFYRSTMSVQQTLAALRSTPLKTARSLFIADSQGRLESRVLMQDLALAKPEQPLDALAQPVKASISPLASRDEVADLFATRALFDLPVVDINGMLLGVIVHANLVQTVQDSNSADIQSMVGVSREERALSSPFFAVKKRMPWLQVNLLTAFLAAAVVGLFESTIAQFTALAILLPVVAGQSGNAGAQALAVTMRGLALREITIRHWFRVMFKEIRVGLINGLGIALSCGIGVYFWSGSWGLVAVIALSMVMAMIAAGFAGAVVPIALVRLGQDPAQSSSIILTTITDVAGFFSFLGIATLLMRFL